MTKCLMSFVAASASLIVAKGFQAAATFRYPRKSASYRQVLAKPDHNSLDLIPIDEDQQVDSAFHDLVDGGLDDSYDRDTSDMMEEREDRLYVDESGREKELERCILVGVEDLAAKRRKLRHKPQLDTGNANRKVSRGDLDSVYFTLEESLVEMRELVKTAGLQLMGEVTQRLNEVNPKTYIGSGKVHEAIELMKESDCTTIVFDAELTPGQQKALENAFNQKTLQNDFQVQDGEIKVVDRTALILDIFAQHARTREGKLQVHLALCNYRKPRLTRMWSHLERQRATGSQGGVGLRGPGESQLEIDKRLLRDQIIGLKQKIDDVQKQRSIHRRGRKRLGLPMLSLVGYTNAGKSSLLNTLTRSGVLAESMLFATLDPTTRKVKLPGYKTHPEVLLTDTVGFIQKLPTHLVAAFRATLEEVEEADVLIHVIDVSNPTWQKQEESVLSTLKEIGVLGNGNDPDRPIVRVLNKIDLLDPEETEEVKYEAAMAKHTVAVSALQGEGLQDFVSVVEEALMELLLPVELEIPYSKGEELNIVHEQGHVEVVDYRQSGTYVRALVPAALANRLEKYSVADADDSSVGSTGNTPAGDEVDWTAIGRGRHSALDA